MQRELLTMQCCYDCYLRIRFRMWGVLITFGLHSITTEESTYSFSLYPGSKVLRNPGYFLMP